MAVTVKKITLWRGEVDNRPGVLAKVLTPLADAGVDLQVVMGYRFPGDGRKAAIEVAPVTGKKTTTAAQQAGLGTSAIPTLLVTGDNKPGLGAAVARAVAEAGINLAFLIAQVIESRFSAVMGFENDDAARQATSLIKKAAKQLD